MTKQNELTPFQKAARLIGSLGGKVTSQKYSKEQLSEWGKRGGRPKIAKPKIAS